MESRREFLRSTLALHGAALTLLSAAPVRAQGRTRPPTPACGDGSRPTASQTEGPYFKARSPQRSSLLEPGLTGTRIVVSGSVVSTDCAPIARALVDFWQADDGGAYDNTGFRLRGHQFTDAAGRYRLETVVPGLYPGRARHFHVKVQAPGQRLLTTQLYFPGDPGNRGDFIFDPALVLSMDQAGAERLGTFDFVLKLG
jgi:protocatechuate 3,4-dioxygenase beta subunit